MEVRRQEEEPESTGGADPGFLHLTLEDDQLVAEQRILRNQLGATELKIGSRAHEERRTSGLREMTEGVIQPREEVGQEAGVKVDK